MNVKAQATIWKTIKTQTISFYPLDGKLKIVLENPNMNPLAETSIAELSSPVSDPKVLQLFAYDWDDLAKSFFIY